MPDISIKLIAAGDRLRPADPGQVAAIAASIKDVGLLNPVTVCPRRVMVDHIMVDGYGLIAGLHRLTACKELGFTEIAAHVVTIGELQRQIAECDENLCGPRLSAAERAMFTRRRKDAYEALHPETRHGATGGTNAGKERTEVAKLASSVDRFTADTAAKTGHSERKVQREAERGEKIDDEVLAKIAGTHLDSGAYLDSLKGLSAVEQRAKVNANLDKQKREAERQANAERDAHEARVAAEWLVGAVGRQNVVALITTLESVPVRRLCEELRRGARP